MAYAELATLRPHAGGEYVYLREAFSPLWGFLYGWTLFMVIQTGTMSLQGIVSAQHNGEIFGWSGVGFPFILTQFVGFAQIDFLDPIADKLLVGAALFMLAAFVRISPTAILPALVAVAIVLVLQFCIAYPQASRNGSGPDRESYLRFRLA